MSTHTKEDHSANLIIQEIVNAQEPSVLWLADEHFSKLSIENCINHSKAQQLHVLSNRYHSISLQNDQHQFEFNDFSLDSNKQSTYDAVYLRITKEKAVYQHLITLAFQALSIGGHLFLAGEKNEGIKSALKYSQELFASPATKLGKNKQSMMHKLTKEHEKCSLDASQHYQSDISLNLEQHYSLISIKEISSKPGQYGWKKVDTASQILASHYTQIHASFKTPPQRFLDLGCGYGYLTVQTKDLNLSARTATDNNAAALISCKKNCSENGIECDVIASDIAKEINGVFDWIVCNPPFHRGFFNDASLLISFLEQAKKLLSNKGKASFVVNEFIPLEREAKKLFNTAQLVEHSAGFKVYSLSKS